MSRSYPDLNLTTFPETADTFVQMLDIVASDAPALTAYQAAMQQGNITQANQALATMADAVQKILTADKINKIFDSIEALQRFLATDIVPYVEQLQAAWQNEVNKFVYRGDYNSSTIYSKNNIVSFVSGAYTFLYLCIANTRAGISPTNTAYWQQFTIVGKKGASGNYFSFLGSWDNLTDYELQDCVIHNNILWGSVVANTNSEPTSTNPNWIRLASLAGAKYPIQSAEPAGQEINDIWFQQIGADF